jgi:hypothetical protein
VQTSRNEGRQGRRPEAEVFAQERYFEQKVCISAKSISGTFLTIGVGRALRLSDRFVLLFAWLRWVGQERGVVSPNDHRGQSASSVTSLSGIDSIAL